MLDAEYEHHRTARLDRMYPSMPLRRTRVARQLSRACTRREGREEGGTHSRLSTTENMLRRTSGRMQYPRTDAVRYASMPLSDMRLRRQYMAVEPIRATP